MAIEMADVVLDLTPPDTEADGTLAEVAYADKVGTPVRPLPPGDAQLLAMALAELATLPR
jgi:hypothetical protein